MPIKHKLSCVSHIGELVIAYVICDYVISRNKVHQTFTSNMNFGFGFGMDKSTFTIVTKVFFGLFMAMVHLV